MTSENTYSGIYTVVGPPGCGKTTFLARQIEAILAKTHTPWGTIEETPVLVCSLTRTAAQEVVRKVGSMNVPLDPRCIGTLHSHAYRALGSPQVMDEKAIAEWNEAMPNYALGVSIVDPDEPDWEDGDRAQRGPGDEAKEAFELLRSRQVPRVLWPPHVEIFARRWEDFKKQTDRIDFADMIERAYHEVPVAPGVPSVILADEAQDHSRLEFALLHKWAEAASALIMVGDAYQALYTWRGAAPEMLLPADTDPSRYRVLAQSYRVPAAAHAVATRWVSQLSGYRPIEYRPRQRGGSSVAGEVRRNEGNAAEPSLIVDEAARLLDQTNDEGNPRSVMIAASCSYLLQKLVQELRHRGIPFCNPWRPRRGDWNPLGGGSGVTMAQRLLGFLSIDPVTTEEPRLWTWAEFRHWTQCLRSEGVLKRGMKQAIVTRSDASPDELVTFTDVFDAMEEESFEPMWAWVSDRQAFADREETPPPASMKELCRWFEERLTPAREKAARYPLRMLSDRGPDAIRERPRIYVGTIHSFKGAEADDVFVMPDLSPAGWREWLDETGGGRDSVIRLFYVALTRTRESLILCEPAGSRSVDLLEPHQ